MHDVRLISPNNGEEQLVEATNSDTTYMICDETTVLTIHCPLISHNLARTDAVPTQKLISSFPPSFPHSALFKSIHYHAGRSPNQAATGSRTFWSLIRGFPELDPYYLLTVCVGLCCPKRYFRLFVRGHKPNGNKATAVDIAHTQAETDRHRETQTQTLRQRDETQTERLAQTQIH